MICINEPTEMSILSFFQSGAIESLPYVINSGSYTAIIDYNEHQVPTAAYDIIVYKVTRYEGTTEEDYRVYGVLYTIGYDLIEIPEEN